MTATTTDIAIAKTKVKITASASEWLRALGVVGVAIKRRQPIAVLHGVLIDPETGRISSYDYNTSASTLLTCITEGHEPVVISRRWLYDSIKLTTGRKRSAPVTLDVEGDKATVTAGGYTMTADVMPAADYPLLPEPSRPTIILDTQAFKAAVKRTAAAASRDDTLPLLTSIRIDFSEAGMHLWSTDRYRLVSDFIPGDYGHGHPFCISAKNLTALLPKLDQDTVSIGFEGSGKNVERVTITWGDNAFIESTIDGDYPKLQTLFPTEVRMSTELDRAVLLESATIAAKMTPRNVPCLVRINEGGATVTFTDGLIEESKSPIAAGQMVLGDDAWTVAFNPDYLIDALKSVTTEKIRLSATTAPKPWVFTEGAAAPTEMSNYRHLLMPVRMPQ